MPRVLSDMGEAPIWVGAQTEEWDVYYRSFTNGAVGQTQLELRDTGDFILLFGKKTLHSLSATNKTHEPNDHT